MLVTMKITRMGLLLLLVPAFTFIGKYLPFVAVVVLFHTMFYYPLNSPACVVLHLYADSFCRLIPERVYIREEV